MTDSFRNSCDVYWCFTRREKSCPRYLLVGGSPISRGKFPGKKIGSDMGDWGFLIEFCSIHLLSLIKGSVFTLGRSQFRPYWSHMWSSCLRLQHFLPIDQINHLQMYFYISKTPEHHLNPPHRFWKRSHSCAWVENNLRPVQTVHHPVLQLKCIGLKTISAYHKCYIINWNHCNHYQIMLIYLGVVSTIADVDSKLSIDCAEDTVPSVPLNTNILHRPSWLKIVLYLSASLLAVS